MIYDIIKNDFANMWQEAVDYAANILLPIFMPHIVSVIIVGVLVKIICFFTYDYFRYFGYSRRESKRRSKRVGKFFDVIFAMKDINDVTQKG